ncbi:VPLPA-CTERM sorting domain-containing protein [Cereibacter sphaeroides]|uniref:VPLPA-CTERM sorting domain-containing protein n=1 Tax=Cereibacter sphaeroides TaxID=1063 RepID=UPI001F2DDBF2|nr:VPLPA-CTERM sorting domain-containing protein [Cereibacter sphaeroides]MCE6950280.1 VPLPA-CTERM sorting domain-containing protein [Cereibacter sphaeroides]MCE6958704.1 VPLPA-CTERM sorting domain-containing protein [Cereibacter sphaeroides]MCE6973413.1 VPLPA-CTERM sorting domain-containing protein [Cereibacter sphaeroides]
MTGKFFKMAALCLALGVAAPKADAATLSFVVDRDASSVELTRNGRLCLGNCSVTASLASGLTTGSTYEIGTGDTATFDFLTFTGRGQGLGWEGYAVNAVLAFSSPFLHVSGTGLFTTTALGVFRNGDLIWDTIAPVTINGSQFRISFDSGTGMFAKGQRTMGTTASITGVNVVPLPATGLLLVAGLGGLALLRRRRQVAAA